MTTKRFLLLILGLLISMQSLQAHAAGLAWQRLDAGLSLARYQPPDEPEIGDGVVAILKIDPDRYDFSLFSAKQAGERRRTAEQWARAKDQIAVINAGMYRKDRQTNVGYMRNFGFTNNPAFNDDNAILAFNRKDERVPAIRIIDRRCQPWRALMTHYRTFSQSIRMVDCRGRNTWRADERRWSIAALGIDDRGNALFVFSRTPRTVHDFIAILLDAPIGLRRLMYLEGGSEASLYVHAGGVEIRQAGSHASRFHPDHGNDRLAKIPNVIGISKR